MQKRIKSIHSEKYIKLIEDLSDERKRLGISQSEVASFLNMTQSEISKIETNERRIDIYEFQSLISIYRINENQKLKKIIFEFFKLDCK
ncbi:helix-turn-helix domain-containing protein [Francisellaceae bacterium]|nr:helix-turn-helix domain-containing protein [Francisellaceae bacterium]